MYESERIAILSCITISSVFRTFGVSFKIGELDLGIGKLEPESFLMLQD